MNDIATQSPGLRMVPDYYMPGRESDPRNQAVNPSPPSGREPAIEPSRLTAADAAGDEEQSLGFLDLLDIINPLQHIPVIGDLYRALTGDEISPAARLAGGTLFGGPLGFLSASANLVVEGITGDDIGGNLLAMVSGEDDDEGVADEVRIAALAGPTPTAVANPEAVPVPPAESSKPANVEQSPNLSPAAFQALMGSFEQSTRRAAPAGLTAGGEAAPVPGGTIRDTALEIDRVLRGYANGRARQQ